MQLYSKEGLLFLVQADHLTGEIIGNTIESFYEAGAKNVQVVSSVTKKNRPAYMIFIDSVPKYAEKIEEIIVKELRSSGWHRIETTHRHTNVSIIEKEIEIRAADESRIFSVRGKIIDDDFKNIRPEYEDIRELKEFLYKNAGLRISVKELEQAVFCAFREDKNTLIF